MSATGAIAADPVRGNTLYHSTPGGTSCSNSSCHGTDPTRNQNNVLRGANAPSVIQNAINNGTGGMDMFKGALSATDIADIAAYIGNPTATASPAASVSPTALSFASTTTGSSSAAQTVTVRNSGSAALSITSITVSGADFARSGGTCTAGGSVAAGASCTIGIVFSPQATGTRTGSLAIAHNATGSPSTVSLSGTATAPVTATPGIAPASLNFGAVNIGTPSAAQSATVSNTGSGPMQLGTLSVTNAAFHINGGTCAAGATVAAGGSCTVSLQFTPTTSGAASGTLSVTHNAGAALTVALSGTGNAPAAPIAQLSPAALSFSQLQGVKSAARNLTLANTGTAALNLSSVSLVGAAASDYAIDPASTCASGSSINPGSSCTIAITFTPSVLGSRNASLSVVHNDAAHSPSVAALNGTGTGAPSGQIAVNQLALSFPSQAIGGASAPKTVTVSNSGTAPLTLSSIGISGANAADFAINAASTTCDLVTAMAPAAACTVGVIFTPASAATRTAQIDLASSASNSSATVALTGTGTSALTPAASFSPTSLDLGSAIVGVATASRATQLRNAGGAPLTISSLAVSPAVFTLSHDCPATLPAGGTCTLTVSLTPAALGAVGGAITLVSNAPASPTSVALSGAGITAPVAALSWQGGSALTFADTDVGSSAAALDATLINSGGATAAIQQLQMAGANASDFVVDAATTCGSALSAGASCRIAIGFAPSAAGARSAALNVVTDGNSPGALLLSGHGVATGAPVLTLTPSFITLTSDPNQPLRPEALVISNEGNALLKVFAIHASPGLQVLDGTAGAGGTCPPPPFDLLPGMSCTVMVAALSNGPIDATIVVVSNADVSPMTAKVSGAPVTNAGAGGCSIGPPNRPRDPIWALMLGAAIVVLIARRRRSRDSTQRGVR